MKKELLLDCDGIISDFLTPSLKIVKELTGISWTIHDLTDWDFFASLSKEQADICYEEIRKPGFCKNLKPYEEATHYLPQIIEIADVHIVTSPLSKSLTWAGERENWLYKHFKIEREMISHTSAKHKVIGDIFVDDSPVNVKKWRDKHPSKKALLWNLPYNKDEELTRVYSWKELLDILK